MLLKHYNHPDSCKISNTESLALSPSVAPATSYAISVAYVTKYKIFFCTYYIKEVNIKRKKTHRQLEAATGKLFFYSFLKELKSSTY